MTDTTPEAHEFVEAPENPDVCAVCGVTREDHPVPEAPGCAYPDLPEYRTEGQARMILGRNGRRYSVEPCPVGHWHLVPRRNPDTVPNPDPVPVTSEPETETRGRRPEPGSRGRRPREER